MEVSSLWKTLPITILNPVQQQTGFKMQSSKVADRGFHISGLRQFELGDSFRSISKKHYIRNNEEVIIERHPEHNALILILVDMSASMLVGSSRRKIDASLDLLRHFGSSCLWQGNKLQVLAFSNTIELESEVITTFEAFDNFHEELAGLAPDSEQTCHSEVVDQALFLSEKATGPADLICIISDFLFPEPLTNFYRDITLLQEKTDVVALIIRDLVEEVTPQHRGCLKVRDAESGEFLWLSEVNPPDTLFELNKQGVEACMLTTKQNDEEWYIVLEDFFSLRKEGFCT